jgi:hypothetical protein
MHLNWFWTLPPSSKAISAPRWAQRSRNVDRAVGVAHHDDRHVAQLVGAVVAFVGDVGFGQTKFRSPPRTGRISRL